jgi:hypothetical protein
MKTFGKRKTCPITVIPQPPTTEQRDWIKRMVAKTTGAPKGVFRYHTMEEANQDMEKWNASVVTEQIKFD